MDRKRPLWPFCSHRRDPKLQYAVAPLRAPRRGLPSPGAGKRYLELIR